VLVGSGRTHPPDPVPRAYISGVRISTSHLPQVTRSLSSYVPLLHVVPAQSETIGSTSNLHGTRHHAASPGRIPDAQCMPTFCLEPRTELPFSPSLSPFLQAGSSTAPASVGTNPPHMTLYSFRCFSMRLFARNPPRILPPWQATNPACLHHLYRANLHKVRGGVAGERVLKLFLRSIARGIVWMPRWALGAQDVNPCLSRAIANAPTQPLNHLGPAPRKPRMQHPPKYAQQKYLRSRR